MAAKLAMLGANVLQSLHAPRRTSSPRRNAVLQPLDLIFYPCVLGCLAHFADVFVHNHIHGCLSRSPHGLLANNQPMNARGDMRNVHGAITVKYKLFLILYPSTGITLVAKKLAGCAARPRTDANEPVAIGSTMSATRSRSASTMKRVRPCTLDHNYLDLRP